MLPKKFTLEYFKQQGRSGGKIGSEARMEKLSPEQRSEFARQAVQAHWERYSAEKAPQEANPAKAGR